jgi:four helix bundle protein
MLEKKDNPIVIKSEAFADQILPFTRAIRKQGDYDIARQILKSGTSIGANVAEAQNPESNADFIHKMKIAAKEASETQFWLGLCQRSQDLPNPGHLEQDIIVIMKILGAIISSSKRNGGGK